MTVVTPITFTMQAECACKIMISVSDGQFGFEYARRVYDSDSFKTDLVVNFFIKHTDDQEVPLFIINGNTTEDGVTPKLLLFQLFAKNPPGSKWYIDVDEVLDDGENLIIADQPRKVLPALTFN